MSGKFAPPRLRLLSIGLTSLSESISIAPSGTHNSIEMLLTTGPGRRALKKKRPAIPWSINRAAFSDWNTFRCERYFRVLASRLFEFDARSNRPLSRVSRPATVSSRRTLGYLRSVRTRLDEALVQLEGTTQFRVIFLRTTMPTTTAATVTNKST
jgi:hypothetical protein